MRQIFLDTETTGLSPESGDRIVEVGCIEMVNRQLTGENKHFYINPERASHEEALRVHGLTEDFLATKPVFAAIADELLDYLSGAQLIIHNASFDMGFLNEELRRLGRPPLTEYVHSVKDSLLMAREMFPGKSNSLDALCKRLEVDNTNRTLHGALIDAALLAEVYIRMTRGQDSLSIDTHTGGETGELAIEAIDFSQFTLPVLQASEEELAAHEAVLVDLDKASGGKTIWRKTEKSMA